MQVGDTLQKHYTQNSEVVQAGGTLAAALAWRKRGISPVPAQPSSKVCRLHWRSYEVELPGLDQVNHWFANGVMNLALVCGSGRLLVLDFDDVDSYQRYVDLAGELAYSYTEITGRGMHAFYRVNWRGNPANIIQAAGVELLGAGHLVTVAPSLHPSGSRYVPVDPGAELLELGEHELITILSHCPSRPVPSRAGVAAPIGEPVGQLRNAGSSSLVGAIKSRVSVIEVAGKLTRLQSTDQNHGRWYVGRCPFHQDHEPSFWVDRQRGLWGCYVTSCPAHRGGDVINLYALAHQVDVRTAIHQLREVACV